MSDASSTLRRARHFDALTQAIGEILFVTTADGRAVEMPAWQELTGQTNAELADFGWLDALHPDDVAPTVQTLQTALASGAPLRTAYRIRDRAGAYRWYEARAACVLNADGTRHEWVGVCLDIDARKRTELLHERQARDLERSERRFRLLVETVASVVWVLPPSGRFESAQPDWQRFTGQTFAQCQGDGWLDAIHPDDRARTAATWGDCIEGASPYEIEHRLRRADGAWVSMAVRAIPIVDGTVGAVREWIGFHTDISGMRHVEAELRSLTADLERRVEQRTAQLADAHDALRASHDGLEQIVQARTADLSEINEEVQRFAYIVSHDLRAPLVNIMGFANELRVLRQDIDDMVASLDGPARERLGERPGKLADEFDESLDFILQSTSKMDRLISAILKLSREGRRAFAPEEVQLGPLCRAIADGLTQQCQARGTGIEIAGDLPTITADRFAVEQILTNLVENAVKYGQPGRPGLIQVSEAPAPSPEDTAIAIADNGRGIAPQDLERVFELFRRAGPQNEKGDGIGLAFVRAQTRRLGGQIECRSTIGSGTVFTLILPKQPGVLPKGPAPQD